MASSQFPIPSDITSLVLQFIICFFPTIHTQNIGNSPSGATVAECGPSLMMLAPCTPFVQGTTSLPALPCCGNLRQFLEENEDLSCLCHLLNEPTLCTVPINRTLTLQLQTLCNLQANLSTCSGLPASDPPSPNSPASQVTFGTRAKSTAAACPVVTVASRSSIMGFNPQSIGAKLDAENHRAMALLTAMVFVGI